MARRPGVPRGDEVAQAPGLRLSPIDRILPGDVRRASRRPATPRHWRSPTLRRTRPASSCSPRSSRVSATWSPGRWLWAFMLALPFVALIAAFLIARRASSATSLAARMFDPTVLRRSSSSRRPSSVAAVRARRRPGRHADPARGATLAALALARDRRRAAAGRRRPHRRRARRGDRGLRAGRRRRRLGPRGRPCRRSSPDDPDFAADPANRRSASGDTDARPREPSATPAVPRINVLLIGMDSGAGGPRP